MAERSGIHLLNGYEISTFRYKANRKACSAQEGARNDACVRRLGLDGTSQTSYRRAFAQRFHTSRRYNTTTNQASVVAMGVPKV